jgi:hypothetical protein
VQKLARLRVQKLALLLLELTLGLGRGLLSPNRHRRHRWNRLLQASR